MPVVDDVSPIEYGEDRLVLELARIDGAPQTPEAFEAVLVDVDYSRALPEGVVLPLEMVVMGPSGIASRQRTVFKRFAPQQLAFVPREGGSHLLHFAEQHHNRWHGSLVIEVAGETLLQEQP